MFYLWGHTYEFDQVEGAWERIEEFMKKISNSEDVWYATNGEIANYMRDFSRLEYSADALKIHNPTASEIFFKATIRQGDHHSDIVDLMISLKPGETIDLSKFQ